MPALNTVSRPIRSAPQPRPIAADSLDRLALEAAALAARGTSQAFTPARLVDLSGACRAAANRRRQSAA